MRSPRLCRYIASLVLAVLLAPGAARAQEGKQPASVAAVPRPEAWCMDRHQGMNQRAKQGNVDLLFVGDSITHDWETKGAAVWKKYYAPRNALNLGTAGDRTQHVLWRLRNGNLDGISPRLAVVMIGTNNSAAGDKPQDTAAGVKAIVSELRSRLPKTKVLLLAIFPRGDNDTIAKANTEVNALLAKLADGKMVHFLDIGPSFLDQDGKVRKDLFLDGVHPNEQGHQVWADAIEPTVVKLMTPRTLAAEDPGALGWVVRYKEFNQRIKRRKVDLVFIGDSITAEWERTGVPVWQKYYAKRNAVGLGIGGDQTQWVLWRLGHGNLEGISPKLAVVMIGTNNASSGDSAADIAAGVQAIVAELRSKVPKTKVLVLAIFPRGKDNNDGLRKINTAANGLIAKVADGKMVYFLNINDKFLDRDGKLSTDIFPDLLHPNAKGYEIWSAAIEPTVAKLMGEK